MSKSTQSGYRAGDILCALCLLTRFPAGCNPDRMAAAAWAWPLAGVAVGIAAALVAAVTRSLGLPISAAAAVGLAVSVIVTGAMHEDGLADTVDGFWGGLTRDRRLEIMKDSHIGSYGVIALVLSLLLRWSLIAALLALPQGYLGLVASAILGRAPMAIIANALPHARPDGLSATTGQVPRSAALVALALSAVLAVPLLGWSVITAAFWLGLAALATAALARAKIGGQTGDVLGASEQIAEITALAVLVAVL